MLRGILWDNDGVLVETEPLYFEVNRDVLRRYQVELTEERFFAWYLQDSCGAWHLLAEQGMPEEEIAALRQQRNRLYTQRLMTASDLAFPGIRNVLESLSGRLAMGVVTSARGEHFEAIHQKTDLLRHFDFVLTREMYTESKPDPEPYLLGLSRLGLSPQECLVIEDSPRGLQAARAAGIRCIVLRNAMTHYYPFEGAFRVVDTMDALQEEIGRLL